MTPALTLSLTGASAIAFDASGDLWVVDHVDSTPNAYTPLQISTLTPGVQINLPMDPDWVVFDPHALNLPLSGSPVILRRHDNAAATRRHR